MGKRQREWAKRAHAKLVQDLGGKCAICGATENLTVDHKNGRNWKLYAKDPSWRVSVYRREAKEGRVQCLCDSCNSRKGYSGDGTDGRDAAVSEVPEQSRLESVGFCNKCYVALMECTCERGAIAEVAACFEAV